MTGLLILLLNISCIAIPESKGFHHYHLSPQSTITEYNSELLTQFFEQVGDFVKNLLTEKTSIDDWKEYVSSFFNQRHIQIHKEKVLNNFPDFSIFTPDFSADVLKVFAQKFKFNANETEKSRNQHYIFQDIYYIAIHHPELNFGLWQNVESNLDKERLLYNLKYLESRGYIQNTEPSDEDIEKEFHILDHNQNDDRAIARIWEILTKAFDQEAKEVFHHSLRVAFFLLLANTKRISENGHLITKIRQNTHFLNIRLTGASEQEKQNIKNLIATNDKTIERLQQENTWLKNMSESETRDRNNAIIMGCIYHDIGKTNLPFAYLVARPTSLNMSQASRINQHEKLSGESLVSFLNEEGQSWFDHLDVLTLLAVTLQPMSNTENEIRSFVGIIRYPVKETPIPVPDKKHNLWDYIRIVWHMIKSIFKGFVLRSSGPLFKAMRELNKELVGKGYAVWPMSRKKKKDLKILDSKLEVSYLKKEAWRSKVGDVVDSLLDPTRPYRREQFPFPYEIAELLRTLRLQKFIGPHSMDLDVVIKSDAYQIYLTQFLFPLASHTFSERIDLSVTNTLMHSFLKNLYLKDRFIDENVHLANVFKFFKYITTIILQKHKNVDSVDQIVHYIAYRLIENSSKESPSLKDSILSIARIKAKMTFNEDDDAPPSSKIITQMNSDWENILSFLLDDFEYESQEFPLEHIQLPKYQGRILEQRESLYVVLKSLEVIIPDLASRLFKALQNMQSLKDYTSLIEDSGRFTRAA